MTKKIAISLPDECLRKAREAVKAGKAPNVSNYIAHLIEDASASESFDDMMATWLADSGASDEEIRAAEQESREAFRHAGLARKRALHGAASRKAG
jgi:Arc/MetJ-type ribon-helix-helix transcriptional regulator